MAAVPEEGRHGLTAFRLDAVPEPIRRRAAEKLLRIAEDSGDPFTAIMLTRAVDSPSDRIYWIPKTAWEEQAQKPTWRRAETAR